MAHKINLVFFAFGNSVPLVKELNAFYRDSNKFDVNNLNSVEEVNQFLGTSGQGIFFFKVTNKADLQKAVSVLKVQKKLIKNGFVKPACVTTIKNKKVEAVLAKYGCVDLLEPDTRAKTASFKLDFWSKPISTHLDQIAKEEERQLKKQESAQNNNEAKEAELFKFTEPLNLESDFWLIKSRADCKKVLRRWLVRVLGPSTFVGNWVELQPQPGDKQPTWKFVLKDPSNTDYVKNDGAWYFYGAKPEFDWKINRWSFSSDLPHLYFYTKSGEVFSRFKYVNGQVEIPMNSEFASTREEMILETCDAQYNFDAEKNKSEDTESLEGQEGEHNPGHMEGKNHAEEDLAGNMEGKGSTDDLGGDPLSGKSSTDELGGDPLAGKVNPGEVKPGDEKKDPTFSEDPIPGHMGGKSSTDDLGGDPLAGKVNPGEVKPGDEKKDPTFSEDPIPGHMGGKSSTDELGGDPLAGKVNPGEVKPGDEKKDPTFSEDPIPGHMGGKSSTDELGGDPLAGKVNPGEVKPGDEKKDPTFSEDPIAGHMGGKSSTDELGGDPLSGSVNQEGKNHGAQESSLANPLDELKKSSQKRPENEGSIYDKEDSPLEEKDDLSEYGVMDGFNPKAEKKDEDGTPIIESSKDKLTHPNKPGDEVSSRSEELTHPDENTHNQIDDTFSDNSAYSNTEYEADMLDALGGGLTKAEKLVHYEGSEQPIDLKTTYIGEAKKEEKKEGPDLNQIIGQEVNLDLESGQLKVVLKQKTSVGNDITFICEFEDFYEDELVVQAPKNSLAVGSHVRAMVSLLYKGEKVKVECAGTIEEIEELSEHKDTLIVTLEKINKENYEKFIALYQERQGSINEFMEMAKGY